jgi:hypothetical protein
MHWLNGSGFIVLYSAVRLDVIIMEPTFFEQRVSDRIGATCSRGAYKFMRPCCRRKGALTMSVLHLHPFSRYRVLVSDTG